MIPFNINYSHHSVYEILRINLPYNQKFVLNLEGIVQSEISQKEKKTKSAWYQLYVECI